VNLSQVTAVKYWVEREGFLNLLPDINNFVRRLPCKGTSKGITKPFPRPYRDVPEAVESGGLARWTQRGPSAAGAQSEFVSKIKSWTHWTHLASSLLYTTILENWFLLLYCVHCVHRGGFAGLVASIVASIPRPGASAGLAQISRKAVPPVPSSRSD
jgi:hypothetical protein